MGVCEGGEGGNKKRASAAVAWRQGEGCRARAKREYSLLLRGEAMYERSAGGEDVQRERAVKRSGTRRAQLAGGKGEGQGGQR